MKKSAVLIIVFLAVIALAAYSQIGNTKSSATDIDSKYIYCELVTQYNYGETKMFLTFGYSSTYQNWAEESRVIKLQKTDIDAINYMSQNRWELVCKNMRDLSGGHETVYVLKKKI